MEQRIIRTWGQRTLSYVGTRWGQCQAQLLSPGMAMQPLCGSHGGGLSSTVVAQEGGDLPLVEVQAQPVDSCTATAAIDLHQITDGDSRLEFSRRLLHQHWKQPRGHIPGQDPLLGAGPLAMGCRVLHWGARPGLEGSSPAPRPLPSAPGWAGTHLGVQCGMQCGTGSAQMRMTLQTSSSSGRGNSRVWGSRTDLQQKGQSGAGAEWHLGVRGAALTWENTLEVPGGQAIEDSV